MCTVYKECAYLVLGTGTGTPTGVHICAVPGVPGTREPGVPGITRQQPNI